MGNKAFSECKKCSVYNKYIASCGKPPTAQDQKLQLIESLEVYNLHYLADVIIQYLPDVSYGIVPMIPLSENVQKDKYLCFCHPHVPSFNTKKKQFLTWKKYIKSLNSPWDIDINCVIFGNAEIGKTALIQRFRIEEFVEEYDETISNQYKVPLFVNKNNRIMINIMDTAGIKEFHDESMKKVNIQNNNFFICCFGINDKQSYDDIMDTIDTIKRIKDDESKNNDFMHDEDNIEYGIILVALKCDLRDGGDDENVDRDGIVSNCKRMNIPYIETSAKENINVDLLFYQIVYELWMQKYINSMVLDE